MANNCAFEMNIRAQTTEDADRVVAILQNRDPIYCIIRGWPDSVFENGGEGTPERCIYGDCPWTAAYMWEPTGTMYGHDLIPGESRLSDGRTVVSIPWLCRTWNMKAWGWEEEAGCEVSGRGHLGRLRAGDVAQQRRGLGGQRPQVLCRGMLRE